MKRLLMALLLGRLLPALAPAVVGVLTGRGNIRQPRGQGRR
jgi:hypothetical protein